MPYVVSKFILVMTISIFLVSFVLVTMGIPLLFDFLPLQKVEVLPNTKIIKTVLFRKITLSTRHGLVPCM